jgi:hypothetical protein
VTTLRLSGAARANNVDREPNKEATPMKFLIHAATASALIAVGSAAAHAASDEAVHPVMVLQHDPALPGKLRRTTAHASSSRRRGGLRRGSFCNLAIRY